MLKMINAYECDNCYDVIKISDLSMCENEDCISYVCPCCEGVYCAACESQKEHEKENTEVKEDGG